jgi:hypothetical protein
LRGYPDVVGPLTAGTLIVNIRAKSAPEALRRVVEAALAASGPLTEVHQLACSRPARPVPTPASISRRTSTMPT